MAPATSSINLQPRSSLLPLRNIQQQAVARSPPWYFRETDQRDRAADSSSHWSRDKLIFLELCLLVYNCAKLSDSAWFSLTIFIANFVIHSSLTERSWSILAQPLIFLVVNAKIWFKFRWLLLFIRLHELILKGVSFLVLCYCVLCVLYWTHTYVYWFSQPGAVEQFTNLTCTYQLASMWWCGIWQSSFISGPSTLQLWFLSLPTSWIKLNVYVLREKIQRIVSGPHYQQEQCVLHNAWAYS